MPNPNQEHPASFKAPNGDLKNMDALCTFKIKIEGQNSENGFFKDHWSYPNQDQNAKPQSMSSKAPYQIFKDMDVLCTFKIKIDSQNSDQGSIKDQLPYLNQDQYAKLQSGTSSVLQSPTWGLKGHGCSLHLQNRDKEPKFGSWVCQRPVTIFKSWSRCQTPVRKLKHPSKPQIRT